MNAPHRWKRRKNLRDWLASFRDDLTERRRARRCIVLQGYLDAVRYDQSKGYIISRLARIPEFTRVEFEPQIQCASIVLYDGSQFTGYHRDSVIALKRALDVAVGELARRAGIPLPMIRFLTGDK